MAGFSPKTLSIARALIESVQDGMFIADAEGYYIMANQAFEDITGINREEVERASRKPAGRPVVGGRSPDGA